MTFGSKILFLREEEGCLQVVEGCLEVEDGSSLQTMGEGGGGGLFGGGVVVLVGPVVPEVPVAPVVLLAELGLGLLYTFTSPERKTRCCIAMRCGDSVCDRSEDTCPWTYVYW